MDAWEWIAILVGGATAAWMLYEKGKESGRQKAFEEFREPPGTATSRQIAEIKHLGQEMRGSNSARQWWNYPSDEAFVEWSWTDAQVRLLNMRNKKREIEDYRRRIAAGGARRLPTEMRLGILDKNAT